MPRYTPLVLASLVLTALAPQVTSTSPGAVASPAPPPPARAATASSAAPFPDAQTFKLHSHPSARRTIYLDFDGLVVQDTYWNDEDFGLREGTFGGFDLDGDAATFSSAERAEIQLAWQVISEDYAPFAVDVTTEKPAQGRIDRSDQADGEYGTVVAVTDDVDAHQVLCGDLEGCAGYAAEGFDAYGDERDTRHAYTTPAWVFSSVAEDGLSIGATAAHEVGHTLGLDHHGSTAQADPEYYDGHGVWAPIMGGTKPVDQWSHGAYPNATRPGQDDLAVIVAHGAPLRADDAGDTVGTASAFPPALRVISTRKDVDVFALGTCTGAVSVRGVTAYASPDLDLELTLLDASGAVLASANPPSAEDPQDSSRAVGMDATVTRQVSGQQQLFVAVDGVGIRTWTTQGYDDYGSLGAYLLSLRGCSEANVVAPGAVTGLVVDYVRSQGYLDLTWVPPSVDGGAPVLGYRVSLDGQPAEDYALDDADYSEGAYHGVGPLSGGSSHEVSVCAYNVVGCGPVTTTAFTVPATAPGRVTGVVARKGAAGGALTVLATWKAPSTGGSPITGYVVTAQQVRNGRAVGTARTFRSGTALRKDVRVGKGSWKLRVRAFNAVGNGSVSGYSAVVTAR